MSREALEKRFIFHGNAVALAAHIRRPQDYFVPAVASCCIPVTGGLAEADSPGQSFRDIISFESASTRVIGDFTNPQRAAELTRGKQGENDLPTRTVAESRVRGLKIQSSGSDSDRRTFLAEQLEIQMESFSQRRSATEFRSLHAVIDGVSVDGYKLTVTTDTQLFSEYETKEKLCRAYEQSRAFRKSYGKRFYPTGQSSDAGCLGGLFGAKSRIPEGRGVIVATLVTGLKWDGKAAPGTEIKGNQLRIEGLGSIHFGEIVIEEDFRRVTLIRFQLGSPDGGDGSVCEVQTNGHTWPPKTG